MREWQFINTGLHSGKFNMKYDIELAEKLQHGDILPTLRVYGWKPWAISLGYNQSEQDIKETKCLEYGFDIVRRPTGGRAILHANELTYSVVMFADGKSVTEVYSEISRSLVIALQKICPEVSYETSQPNFQSLYKKQESIPCFSASARYEVQISGKKLVGSAQRRYSADGLPDVVLQHGSILLGTEHKLLADVLNLESQSIKDKILEDIEQKTIDLSTAAGRVVSFDETAEIISSGFEETMNIRFQNNIEAVL
jgi:lipoate-protein ligase A